MGSIPGYKRFPRGRHDNPLQYSFLENCMDGGAWQVTVHRVAKSQTQLSDFHFTSHKNSILFSFLIITIIYYYCFGHTP